LRTFRAYTNLIARKSNIWSLFMSFDYSAAKAAIKEAGHTVSNGPQVLASDIKEIVKFGRRMFGLNEIAVRTGIGNTELLPAGFPGTVSAPVAPEAAPVAESAPVDTPVPEAAPVVTETPAEAPVTPEAEQAPQDAPAQEAEPAEEVSTATETKTAEESAPAEAHAEEAPAQDAPAAGEQAAQ
jgi:outer membrane biosynthesis protein TonB